MTYLEGKRGDTNNYTGTVLDSAGAVVNLTGATLRFTAKLNRSDADNATGVIVKSTGAGITHISAPAGTYRITLLPADTSALTTATLYFWDLQLTVAGGDVFTVDKGTMTITTDIGVTTP
jgi:hypothetical protein